MKIPKYALFYIPYFFIILGILFACLMLYKAIALNKENNSYNRVMVCVSSVSPTKRVPAYVRYCYDEADKHNGTDIDRFGDGS